MKFVVIVSIISTVLISNYVGVSNNIHSIVYGLEIYFILTLLYNIDKRLSIGDFIVLMASTMYLLVPALMFDLDVQATMPPNLFGYDILAIEPEIYFKFGIWSIMLFHFSFLTIKSFTTRKKVLDAIEALQSNYDVEKVIKIFLIIASISLLLKGTVSSLNLVFFLGIKLSNLIIVLSLFLKEPRKERRYLFIGLAIMLFFTARSAMFGDAFYMLVFYVLFRGVTKGYSIQAKVVAPIIGVAFASFITVFKGAYRSIVWGSETKGGIVGFAQTLTNLFSSFNEDVFMIGINASLYRLNQAYLSSLTMEQVPKNVSFENGETLLETLYSFVPRFFWPGKPILSDRSTMIKYAGYTPTESASMGIGQLGESYVNFGFIGGALWMMVYGLTIALVIRYFLKYSKINIGIVFLPMLLFYAMKPETMFSKVYNFGFKAFIFYLVVNWLVNKYALKSSSIKLIEN